MTDSAGGILRAAMNEGPDAGADMPVDTGSDAFSIDTPSFDDIGSDPTPGDPVVVAPPKVETPKEPNADPAEVPSWRLREIREDRDRIAAANAAYERELQELREFKRQQEAAKKPAVDMFDQPDEFIGSHIQQRLSPIEQRIQAIEQQAEQRFLAVDFRSAVKEFGQETMDKALEAAKQMGPAFINEVKQQASPHAALVDWFNRQELIREFGSDPASARQKFREQALEDPEFLQMALERASSQARPVIERPRTAAGTFAAIPSLNRTTAAQGGDEPDTAADTLRQSLRAPRRRAG